MNNYTIPKIEKPTNGRRFAIGDIHGCANTFVKLIDRLSISTSDQVFLLGDLINRGNDSKAVIDTVLKLQETDFQIYPIRGNHEQSFLMAYGCGVDFFVNYLEENNADEFLDSDIEMYLDLFDGLEYCYDLGDFSVSHSEFLENEKSLYRGMSGLFSSVNFLIEDDYLTNKKQVVGHAVYTIEQIKASIKSNDKIIYLDSGCVYNEVEELGYLTALNLDTNELIIQENID